MMNMENNLQNLMIIIFDVSCVFPLSISITQPFVATLPWKIRNDILLSWKIIKLVNLAVSDTSIVRAAGEIRR